jgi:ABC-type uncharacterized transport system involved in gliding motility auxiliary subunit
MTKKKQLWKLLPWLSLFLVVIGLTVGLVTEKWGVIPLVFLVTGLATGGLWVVWQSRQSKWWERRSTQAGTNAIVATVAVLVILGLFNFLGTRYNLRADLTENQLFTLAPQTKELVSSLHQLLKVWVFDANPNPQDRELLADYRLQNSEFQYEFVDPQANPGLVEKFGVKNSGEVYLEYGNKRQLVQTVDENQRLSEIKLTSGLQQIINPNTAKVYFLQGHGEHPLAAGKDAISQAVQGLGDKDFTASPLNLAEQPKVPDDATVVIVDGPKRSLLEGEVKALQDYLHRGGNLLLMIDANTDPKIDGLLREWGVTLDNRLAIDLSGAQVGIGPAAPLVTDYGKHPITKDFGNGISFYPIARAIETTPVTGVESTPLLLTKPYPNSWAESDLQSEKLEFHEGKDLKGPLTLGVALERKLPFPSTPSPTPSPTKESLLGVKGPKPTPSPAPIQGSQSTPLPTALPSPTASHQSVPTPKESRLVVLGNSNFATDGRFNQELNGDVFLNSVTWLSQENQQPLSIRPKEARNRRILMSTNQANVLALLSLLVLPLIGLVAAAVVWWLRR